MPWYEHDKVVSLRARYAVIDVVVGTLDGWRRHQSSRNAWLLAFFGFLSLFPLMLAATTILGFLLQDNEELQQRILDGALDSIPVIGQTLADDPTSLSGNWWALLVGLGGALWSATRAFVSMQMALDDVWEVDIDDRASMPAQRAKSLLGIVVIGVAQLAGLVLGTVVAANLPLGGRLALFGSATAINMVVLVFMFIWLTSATPGWRDVWPGALGAGLAITVLQHYGTDIVMRIARNAGETYGSFALVLGLVTWLSLLAISTLMCAELNAALMRRGEGSLARAHPANGHVVPRPM